MRIDATTRRWIRNESDERAAFNGCRFNEARGQLVIDFAVNLLKLYEGDCAGEPLIPHDWQHECTMRLFGWEVFDPFWKRHVRRFRRASIWVPKKNKKSPTLAWWAIYLFCADGEMGQKVFLAAKDGSQAREIAGKHCLEMVAASPELSAECDINRTEMSIYHRPTRSLLKPLSSGDSRSQKSKEGLNGSILIDETHVVDAVYVSRLSRAGISRSEPLHAEVSTAGKSVDCYGKTQFDRGEKVIRGEIEDQSYFYQAYAAPQDLSDDELAADPLKYGQMANPAWNHTVNPREFLDDYNASKHSIAELADFKTYRLNIWQAAKSPWLRSSDWLKCAKEFSASDLVGRSCWMGFDHAKLVDMAAIVLVFRMGDDEFWQLPYIFWAEELAKRHKNDAPFLDWHRDGHLRLIPGEVILDAPILSVVDELAGMFKIEGVVYDRTFATEIALQFEERHGITRLPFNQSADNYASPIEDYERLVIQGKLRHPNNAVLNWMAGHCEAATDADDRKSISKPDREPLKKIDALDAGVMALVGAITAPKKTESVYKTRGVVAI